jgi:hypothetical protein
VPGITFSFGGEAAGWLNRTVHVPGQQLDAGAEWIEEFDKLKKRNTEIFWVAKAKACGTKK